MFVKKIVMLGSLAAVAILGSWGMQARAATTTGTAMQSAFSELALVDAEADAIAPEYGPAQNTSPAVTALALKCVEQYSTGYTNCKDAGNFDSTCAVAKCSSGYKLTGGGGACSAGDRKLKSAIPNSSTGEFHVMCEKQGVAPSAKAICCKLGTL